MLEFIGVAIAAGQTVSSVLGAPDQTVDWLRWLFGLCIPAFFGAIYKVYSSLNESIDRLRDKLAEVAKDNAKRANDDDDRLWNELQKIQQDSKVHERNDAEVHLRLTGAISQLVTREDLHRELLSMVDRLQSQRRSPHGS